MTGQPLVSIVTPSYNQATFIEDTIRSVRNQTYEPIEHIVVDGESDDGTLEILREYEDDLRWISEPDDGQSDAINKGFEMANGEYVGWLNSDDVYFDIGVIDRVVEYFVQTNADVIYGDMALLDADSDVLKVYCVPDFDMQLLLRYCFIEQPSLFFRGEVVSENKLDTDLAYVMDYEFWLRLAGTYEFHHVNDVLAGDRNHPERKILGEREEMLAEARELQATYGVTHDPRYQIDRALDKVFSGLPRRTRAIAATLALHRRPLTLAFDGELGSRTDMLKNTFTANRNLL
jgi:glycosyltransferase involved in cell wall biosynthesis